MTDEAGKLVRTLAVEALHKAPGVAKGTTILEAKWIERGGDFLELFQSEYGRPTDFTCEPQHRFLDVVADAILQALLRSRAPALLTTAEQRRSIMNAEAMTWVRVYGAMVLRDGMRVDPHDALRTLIERDADVQQIEKHGP